MNNLLINDSKSHSFFRNKQHKTAIRLLSLPPASADAERFWSVMAPIHTSERNCLANTRASIIAKNQIAFNYYMQDHQII